MFVVCVVKIRANSWLQPVAHGRVVVLVLGENVLAEFVFEDGSYGQLDRQVPFGAYAAVEQINSPTWNPSRMSCIATQVPSTM